MRLFDLLSLMNSALVPEQSKIHLATWNGKDEPLDVYLGGGFDDWQSWQTKRNFERDYVVSLIRLPQADRWLFAGAYRAHGAEWREEPGGSENYQYNLEKDDSCDGLAGRMVLAFSRSGRQAYLNAENWTDRIGLAEIYAEPLTIGDFPGYRAVDLSRDELLLIFRQAPESWRTALSSVAGVYLISDTISGGLYVGAAYGEGGFWQRWSSYAATGDGGNVEIRELLAKQGKDRLNAFRYSILEIADTHASEQDILGRETHWKKVLLTRSHGLNAN